MQFSIITIILLFYNNNNHHFHSLKVLNTCEYKYTYIENIFLVLYFSQLISCNFFKEKVLKDLKLNITVFLFYLKISYNIIIYN